MSTARMFLGILLLLSPSVAMGGVNAGGSLLLHCDPSVVYTSDLDYCGQSGLASRQEATVTLTADTLHARVMHLLAAFPEGSGP